MAASKQCYGCKQGLSLQAAGGVLVEMDEKGLVMAVAVKDAVDGETVTAMEAGELEAMGLGDAGGFEERVVFCGKCLQEHEAAQV